MFDTASDEPQIESEPVVRNASRAPFPSRKRFRRLARNRRTGKSTAHQSIAHEEKEKTARTENRKSYNFLKVRWLSVVNVGRGILAV